MFDRRLEIGDRISRVDNERRPKDEGGNKISSRSIHSELTRSATDVMESDEADSAGDGAKPAARTRTAG